jgi:hypothetical protein
MSTLASAALSSDDEDDQDFQLPEPKAKDRSRKRPRADSASGSSSSGSEDEVDTIDTAEAQKLKAEQKALEDEERRSRAKEAFKAMQTGSTSAANKASSLAQHPAMVEVQRTRNFAGEAITYVDYQSFERCLSCRETVMLPPDHPDAIAYLKKESTREPTEAASTGQAIVADTGDVAVIHEAEPSKPKAKPPPRRKPRQSLEAMSAALDKGKKMTTLEKVSYPRFERHDISLMRSHKWIGRSTRLEIEP